MNKVRYILIVVGLALSMLVFIGCGRQETDENTSVLGSMGSFLVEEELDSMLNVEVKDPAVSENTDIVDDALQTDADNVENQVPEEENVRLTEAQELAKKYPYYIKVNESTNCITIYSANEDGEYTIPYKAMVCSVGRNGKTPNGTFSLSSKYTWHTLNGGVYGQYCSRITGHVLFHSVPYSSTSKDKLITKYYNQLGNAVSAGCIRLTVADAKWIFDNCPSGTQVEIFNGNSASDPLGKPSAVKIDTSSPYARWDPTDPDADNPWRNQPPVIDGVIDYIVEYGQSVDVTAGVTATDYLGQSVAVAISGNVDFNKIGSYAITYTATDANGRTTTATSTIVIQDTIAPIISTSSDSITVVANSTAADVEIAANAIVTVSDLSEVSVSYEWNSVASTCTITATDSVGNTTTKTITVNVKS